MILLLLSNRAHIISCKSLFAEGNVSLAEQYIGNVVFFYRTAMTLGVKKIISDE